MDGTGTPSPGASSAQLAGAIRIRLRGPLSASVAQLSANGVRFFLDGESTLVHAIYEMLHCDLLGIAIQGKAMSFLPGSAVAPVGFESEEALLDYSQRSFVGYRLLQEYFAFPEKFLFFDLRASGEAWAAAGVTDSADLYFLFSSAGENDRRQRLETGVTPRMFRLNCVPIVNLFEQTCEPILLDQRSYDYPLVPDTRRPLGVEIYSIDRVSMADAESQEIVQWQPFYSPGSHGQQGNEARQRYWMAYRRPSNKPQDPGTDISFHSWTRPRG